ncbi:MAG TPA: hypothetical protein DCE41_27365, partial [Cytophagales bacterium]|nr:hypothetical protein [Cytophagales bacterium]
MKKPLIITISFSFLLAMGIMAWSYVPTPEAIAPPLHVQAENEYEELLLQFGLGSKMAEYGVPGTSFAFIKNGELHWAKGYGVL